MIKNNKVINRILLPKILGFCVIVATSLGVGTTIIQDTKNHPNKQMNMQDQSLLVLMAVVIMCFGGLLFSEYKQGESFSKLVTRKYLRQIFATQPELKIFNQVLSNPQALQNVTQVIFNSLRPYEQKRIAKIISEMHKEIRICEESDANEQEEMQICKLILHNTRTDIVKILAEHASLHPEFMHDIQIALAKNDMIYIASKNQIQQHTR